MSDQGKYDKALEFYEKALNIRTKVFGKEHSRVASIFENIGELWYKKKDFKKAIKYYEKELSITIKIFGRNHKYTADSLFNLGVVWNDLDNHNKTLEYCEKSLRIRLKVFGEEHPSITDLRFLIGINLMKKQRFMDSIHSFEIGYKHNKSAGFPFNIAECYEKLNKPVDAIKYYKESAELRKKEHGINDVDTIKAAKKAFTLAKENNLENTLPDWINKFS